MKAQDLLKNNETAVAIFTDGRELDIKTGGKSLSGVWRINPQLDTDKVIIYLRNKETGVNEIYIGDFTNLIPSKVEGLEHRFSVEFANTEFVGETTAKWHEFTNSKHGSANPIKMIK